MTKLAAQTIEAIHTQKEREARRRAVVTSQFGSIRAYIERLQVAVFNSPSAAHLADFYALYERCFPLEEERESIAGFQKVLALNSNAQAQAAYGPAEEHISVAFADRPGRVVGAANYILMPYDQVLASASGYDGSCQLNFLCVDPDYRGVGIARRMLELVREHCDRRFALTSRQTAPSWFITIEQNSPDRMSPEQIEADALAALIDPRDRSHWWRRNGFRKLALAYVQPPLSKDHAPCAYIDYFVQANGQVACLPAVALLEHLRRFFYLSVGKLEVEIETSDAWQMQRAQLQANTAVRILNDTVL